MLVELNDIGSTDDAAKWAHRRLAEKNKLNTADARHIEEIFRAKLLSFAIHEAEGSSQSEDRSVHFSSALNESQQEVSGQNRRQERAGALPDLRPAAC